MQLASLRGEFVRRLSYGRMPRRSPFLKIFVHFKCAAECQACVFFCIMVASYVFERTFCLLTYRMNTT